MLASYICVFYWRCFGLLKYFLRLIQINLDIYFVSSLRIQTVSERLVLSKIALTKNRQVSERAVEFQVAPYLVICCLRFHVYTMHPFIALVTVFCAAHTHR